MICPLSPSSDGSSNYIDQTCHVPVSNPPHLQRYFSYFQTNNFVHGAFVIRTQKTLRKLKENPLTMTFLQQFHITLLQTNWVTERKKELYFLYGASKVLTRRDDLKTTIKENMTEPKAFCLYSKQHTHVCNGVRTVFCALFINALEEKFDTIMNKIAGASMSGDSRLDGIQLIPVRPTTT